MSEERIAIVGMACRVPGADNLEDFRKALRSGDDRFTELDSAQLLQEGLSPAQIAATDYVRRVPLLGDIDGFDADYFGLSSTQAELLDPQHRLFLECAVEALEAAGVVPDAEAHVGVFAGASISAYLLFNLLPRLQPGASPETLLAMAGNDKDYLASHTAYLLGLRGPAVGVQTACSSSLVAVHYAARSLLAFECDVALAGGVTLRVPQRVGYRHEPGSILSPSGACRSFDAAADGTVFGSGAGVVTLCRLSDAQRDGRPVHAVLLGSAVNNDGRAKAGFTAPGLDGQAAVVAEAMAAAGLGPDDIGYIEGHGTGTPIGDPIEVRALDQVFGPLRPGTPRIALRSAKACFGHLEAASGVIGLISATVSLRDAVLPALPHFSRANPQLRVEQTRFALARDAQPWPAELPRRAGVSSFGIGGTNAHVILQAAPADAVPDEADHDPRPWVYAVSARSLPALREALTRHATALESGVAGLAARARMAALGRSAHPVRCAVVASSCAEAAARLRTCVPRAPPERPQMAWVFSGQGGSSWPKLSSLRRRFDVLRASLDRAALRCPDIAAILRGEIAPAPSDTANLQPALFALQAAVADQLRAFGLQPHAVCGHSVGEIAAAYVAGMIGFDEGLDFAAARGRAMAGLDGGAMAVVLASAEALAGLLEAEVEIAAVNAPAHLTLSGPEVALQRCLQRCAEAGLETRRLDTRHAFHSSAMDVCQTSLTRVAPGGTRRATLPFVSSMRGELLQAIDQDYWAAQARAPVRFDRAIDCLVERGSTDLLEIGPGAGLTALLQLRDDHVQTAAALGGRGDDAALLAVMAWAFEQGFAPDWSRLSGPGQLAELPTYPFQRHRYWLQPPPPLAATNTVASLWPDRPDWLREHEVDGRCVMPAAGLVAFALAASGARTLGEFRFEAMLEIPAAGIELRLQRDGDALLALCASEAGGPLQRYASVSIRPAAARAMPVLALSDDLREVTAADFYAGLRRDGIALGPALQRLQRIQVGEGVALAQVHVEAAQAHGFGSPLHPALLDAMFQVLAGAVGRRPGQAQVPVSIEALRFSDVALPSGPLPCVARLRDGEGDLLVGDIVLFGATGTALVEVQGLASRPISSDPLGILHRPVWIEDRGPGLPGPQRIAASLQPAPDAKELASQAAYLAAVDRLAAAYVARALAQLSESQPLTTLLARGRVAPRHAALLQRYLAWLDQDGLLDGEARLRETPPLAPLVDALRRDHPGHAAENELLIRCGDALPEVLAGRRDAVSVLFEAGSDQLGDLYAESDLARRLNQLLVAAVLRAVEGRDALRILEVGGGTAGSTRHLLPALDGRLADYLFTDVSPAFLAAAEQRFAGCVLRTALFDLEQPPAGPDFPSEPFDVVLAANVLHATTHLREAVAHASERLAPGGWLVLLEGFRASRWLDLTFALSDGWWRRRDLALRPDYPLIDAQAWQALLGAQGFDDVAVLTLGSGPLAEQGLLLARKSRLGEPRLAPLAAARALPDSAAALQVLQTSLQPGARLLIPTCGAAAVRPHEAPSVQQAAITGLARAIRLEAPDSELRLVDIDPMATDPAATLAQESRFDDGESRVAWRGMQRYVERLAPLTRPPALPARFELRRESGRHRPVSVDAPALGPLDVEIAVVAAGLNFKDVLTALGLLPQVAALGSECAGYISRLGSAVQDLAVGDAVLAFGAGAFASHVAVPRARVLRQPPGWSAVQAASLPVAATTAVHALLELRPLKPGDKVLIHAASGAVGYYALALARAAGAVIYATAGQAWKRECLRGEGACEVFDSRSLAFADGIREREPQGLDVVLNCLGGEAIDASLGLLRAGGCFIELGRHGIREVAAVARAHPQVDYRIVALDSIDDARGGDLLRKAVEWATQTGLPPPPINRFAMHDIDAAMALMQGAGHVGKIVLENPVPFRFDPVRSYLITGAMGGIGTALTSWAVARGARHLHLTCHSPASGEQLQRLESLREGGVRIDLHRVDLADPAEVDALLDTIAAQGPPLAGLFHAAGRLDDASLANTTSERLAFVAAPKVEAARQFDRRLPELDAFVLFSSAAGVLGSAGQGNHAAASAALDAIADARHARGGRALAIDWGAWSGIGAAERHGAVQRLQDSGIRSISPQQGLAALELALDLGLPRLVALPLDRERLAAAPRERIFDLLLPKPAPAERASSLSDAPGEPTLQALAGLPASRRIEQLASRIEGVARQLMSLGLVELDHQRPLQESGLDSLMAIELRNRLGRLSGQSLPATLLFNHPSIASLAALLDQLLFASDSDTPASAGPSANAEEELLIIEEEDFDQLLSQLEQGLGEAPQ